MYDIEKMVERTFKTLQCLRYIIFKSVFNHIFCFIYEIKIFEHKRSNDFYRTLKKAVLKKVFFKKNLPSSSK